jgi:hypothetical protein
MMLLKIFYKLLTMVMFITIKLILLLLENIYYNCKIINNNII